MTCFKFQTKLVFKTKIYIFIIYQLSNISICLLMNHSTLSLTLSFFLPFQSCLFHFPVAFLALCVTLWWSYRRMLYSTSLFFFPLQHFYLPPLTAVVWLRALLRFFSLPFPANYLFSLSLCLPPFILKNLVDLSYFVIIITITEV